VDPATVSPTCPRCGGDVSAGAERCGRCGFGFLDDLSGTRRRRPSGPALAGLAAAVAAAAVAAVVLAGGDRDAARGAPVPGPVPALEAERRLELRFGGMSDDETAAVRCPRGIPAGRIVRCELRYPDGIPRALLVRLSARGELEADVPYPATLRR
jgi:hypothetical protein